jgi:hypothetical protein
VRPAAARTVSGIQRAQTPAPGVQVQEVATADGGTIREYVSASGVVFAVSWRTRLKPRLEGMLGRYHADYAAAAAGEAARRPGIRRQAALGAPDLVVRSSSYLGSFSGYAFVPSLAPAGFGPEAVR